MSIKAGSEKIDEVYIYNKKVSRVFLGTRLIFKQEANVPPPEPPKPPPTQTYSVKTQLTYVNIDNEEKTVPRGGRFYATLTPYPGYSNLKATVRMGTRDVTDDYYYDNGDILIDYVTGDITITASASKDSSGGGGSNGGGGNTFRVDNILTNVRNDNPKQTIERGDMYFAQLTPIGCDTISYVDIRMGNQDENDSYDDVGNIISIYNVTGNITITARACGADGGDTRPPQPPPPTPQPTKYHDVIHQLTAVNIDNKEKRVPDKSNYHAILSPYSGYKMGPVVIKMGSKIMTGQSYNPFSKEINIDSVTDTITISATATNNSGGGGDSGGGGATHRVTTDFRNLRMEPNTTSVKANSRFNVELIATDDSYVDSYTIKVTMNGQDATSYYSPYTDTINIPSVTGPIHIKGSSTNSDSGGGGGWEPEPEPKPPSPTMYSVDTSFTKVKSDNTKSSVQAGSRYVAKLSPTVSGYNITTVTITMGGYNANQYYSKSTSTITIPSVSGPLFIKAVATQEAQPPPPKPPQPGNLTPDSIVLKDWKAHVTKGGYTEIFDTSYIANTGNSKYAGAKKVTGHGETMYLSLLSSAPSKFKVDGKIPDSGGYSKALNQSGEPLPWGSYPFPSYNNWQLTCPVKLTTIIGQKMSESFFKDSLKLVNLSYPGMNIYLSSSARSYVEFGNYTEEWLGVTARRNGFFAIAMNKRRLDAYYGSFQSSGTVYRGWRHTMVHELGHTLGCRDQVTHTPSMYDYKGDRQKCQVLQANDIFYIKEQYLENYGVRLKTYQDLSQAETLMCLEGNYPVQTLSEEEIATANEKHWERTKDLPEDYFDADFDYPDEINLEEAPLIVECNLINRGVRKLDVGFENFMFDFDIYEISNEVVLKGELVNREVKIHVSENIEVDANKKYKIYLAQYDNSPCSLLNPKIAIQEI